jgi:hypothetical protein
VLAHHTSAHEAFWAAARETGGDTAGTRALIEVLLHPSVDAGDVSSHHGQRSIQHMHTASPSPP